MRSTDTTDRRSFPVEAGTTAARWPARPNVAGVGQPAARDRRGAREPDGNVLD